MIRRLCFIAVVALLGQKESRGADPLPPELVGEWAAPGAHFRRGALARGSALYLASDGTAALLAAPPPIGVRGRASYDVGTRQLRVDLFDDDGGGRVRETVIYIFDSRARSLASPTTLLAKQSLKRRRPHVPNFILNDIRRSEERARTTERRAVAGAEPVPPPAVEDGYHRVRRGESATSIAAEHGLTLDEVLSLNPHLVAERHSEVVPGKNGGVPVRRIRVRVSGFKVGDALRVRPEPNAN